MRAYEVDTTPDLRDVQALTQRIWSPGSRWHIGDLAWAWNSAPGSVPQPRLAVWRSGETPMAWGWRITPSYLVLQVDPGSPGLADEVLAWFHAMAQRDHAMAEDETPAAIPQASVLEPETHLTAALERAGYTRDEAAPFFSHHTISLQRMPQSVDPARRGRLPDGFRLRPVRPGEAELRASAHRAAWSDLAPSKMTTERYEAVMSAWPYRADLDWIVENPDGDPVASALGWYDEVHRVGLLEPVGCATPYRRMGLGRAVSLAVLAALRRAGAETAKVCPRGDDAYPIPAKLYQDLGFTPGPRTVTYVRGATGVS